MKMSLDERAMVMIPAAKAYGENGAPPAVPPHADLKFEIHLMSITRQTSCLGAGKHGGVQKEMHEYKELAEPGYPATRSDASAGAAAEDLGRVLGGSGASMAEARARAFGFAASTPLYATPAPHFGLEDEDWAFILYDLRNPRFFVFLLFFAFRASRAPSSERSERGHGPLMPPESRHV